MCSLEQAQAAMMQALDHGPRFLPDGLFAGPRARVLAGMKIHANTISHARLVALEETFARTLAQMGHGRFNEHSRLYLEQPGVTARPLAAIGEAFPAYLAQCGQNGATVDLARFEWLWLRSYHSADAAPLRLADLAGLDEGALLGLALARHPSAVAETFDPGVFTALESEAPGFAGASAILIARPHAEVLVSPADAAMRVIFGELEESVTIGNLLARFDEPDCKEWLSSDGAMAALIALLDAGALIRAEQQHVG